ncbi:hypothetical protein [Aliiroseovarius sediminilitoris]|nr:hypothetical protein [Aliiroseovarius sediminilitoris]
MKEDVVELEKWHDKRDMWAQELVEIDKDLETEEDEGNCKLLLDDKAHAQKILGMINQVLDAIGY